MLPLAQASGRYERPSGRKYGPHDVHKCSFSRDVELKITEARSVMNPMDGVGCELV